MPFWYDIMQPSFYLQEANAAASASASVKHVTEAQLALARDLKLLEPCAEPENMATLRSMHARVRARVQIVRDDRSASEGSAA